MKKEICLQAEQLGKRYGKKIWAVRGITFDLKPGVTGLLGPNGAGKSTLMRMLSTISVCTEGRILWNEEDIKASPERIRSVLGYLPQDFGVYDQLNAYEFLNYLAAIKGIPARDSKKRIDELLAWVNLTDAARKPLGNYSGGMRQRVGIAQALLNDPQILIVDEPTVGLDPEERVRFRQLMGDLAYDRIILLSTHIVSDIESIAEQIILMNKGKLLFDSNQSNLTNQMDGKVWELEIDPSEIQSLKQKYLVSSTMQRNSKLVARIINKEKPADKAFYVTPVLEDAYLYLIRNNTE